MKVRVETEPKRVSKRLLALLDTCKSFSWASAWATDNEVVKAALKARKKMAHLVIGTHRYITDPVVLDQCLGIEHVKVLPPIGRLFHPKVYMFDLDNRLEVYVGSSNLTGAGLSTNAECGVFLNAEHDDPKLLQFMAYIQKCWDGADILDAEFITSYKANRKRVEYAQEELKKFTPVKPPRRTKHTANDIAPQDMDWSEFVRRVKSDKMHSLKDRLRMLELARKLTTQRFDRLIEVERKCVAGLRPEAGGDAGILQSAERDGVEWGWFGQMSANGKYNDVLRNNYRIISKAMEHIPSAGPVTKRDYDAYLKTFKTIPSASKTWLGMGTRLIAMRRPDQFVCIDGPNKKGVCGYLGAPYTSTNLDNYWENIIEQVRLTPWFLQEVPNKKLERQIWECRTALLDAIYYDPTPRT